MHKAYRRLLKIIFSIMFRVSPVYTLRRSGAKIGKNVFIGDNVYIELEHAKELTIEDGVVLAAFSKIVMHDSSLNNVKGFENLIGSVQLRKNCYVGGDVTILPGTNVGENTIIGAKSLVKGNLKANSVYFGIPAKRYSSIDALCNKWMKKKEKSKNRNVKNIRFIKQKKWYSQRTSQFFSFYGK